MGDDAKDFLTHLACVAFVVIFLGGLWVLVDLFMVFLFREMGF